MSAIAMSVSFGVMPKKRDTKQLGHRIDRKIAERMEEFQIRHPMQPSIATIIERAVSKWLDEHWSELPAKPKAERR
jgi:hypothetical protein